ncbi:MAG: hypothetical protein RRC34_06375 [Lentisphaeria bacterium]|nr:hypothetical protein [Lentisphaeria bacterium]
MRKKCVFLWLAAAIGLFCLHYGPGQTWSRAGRAATLRKEALACEKNGDWEQARVTYEAALAALPEDGYDRQRRVLRIARAWTYLNTKDVSEAVDQLETLLEETRRDDIEDVEITRDLRGALAHAEYYTAWHMRLENAPREEWLKELEVARRNFRYLAETSPDLAARRNVEAAVFLSRLDRDKLETLPLPEEDAGKGSQGVSDQRGEQQGQGEPGDQEGEGEGEQGENRPEDARGRGLGRRPDGSGS